MTVLAIDTAGARCQVALLHDGDLTAAGAEQPRAHADEVLPLVDALLEERRIALADIERFAFGQGPGGLTGVRVAASVVQGFAFALARPVVAVSNLQALALSALERGLLQAHHAGVVVAHDAGMGQVCWCAYVVDADEPALPRPLQGERFEQASALALPVGDWLGCGTAGAVLHGAGYDAVAADLTLALAARSASAIARLAASARAILLEPAAAQPIYWRHPVDG
jgi:tRNA threonylcarbamoyladenosine biosynthesis protein TsaB